jgi:polysaccharide biosynthesis/export protein
MSEPRADKLDLGRKLLLAAAGITAVIGPVVIGALHAPPLRAQSPLPVADKALKAVPATPVKPAVAPEILAQNQPKPAPDTPKPQAGATDPSMQAAQVDLETYVIHVGDVLYIAMSGARDFTNLYTVNTDRTVRIPLVGGVRAEGLTPLQLKEQLTDALSQVLKNPEVSVTVSEVHKNYYVVGQVKTPGGYPLIQVTTVLDALINAGGFKDVFSNERDILIVRGDQRLHFNYKDYVKGENQDKNIPLQSGDVILVK